MTSSYDFPKAQAMSANFRIVTCLLLVFVGPTYSYYCHHVTIPSSVGSYGTKKSIDVCSFHPFAGKSNRPQNLASTSPRKDQSDDGIEFITFVSSNKLKIQEVQMILGEGESFPWKLECINLDLDEPQATPIEVSQAKCRQAMSFLPGGGPVIVEDTSLCFNALNGLPGPYIKWFYEAIGNEGLIHMLDGFDDRTAYAQCVLSFCLGNGHEVKSFVGIAEGTIIPRPNEPKEKNILSQGFGWDPIFQPIGYDRTFAQMEKVEKNKLSHRFKALRQFKAYVNQRMNS